MKILNKPFIKFGYDDILRPWLPVIIINPNNKKNIRIWGLIDTGADECALPSRYASILEHSLEKGFIKEINTGNGSTVAYSHTVKIQVQDFLTKEVLIDFMPIFIFHYSV